MNTDAMFSSRSDEWETPQDLFDHFDRMFGFNMDVCATPANAKCSTFYTKEQNGLAHPWSYRNWMNPPYGRMIAQWVEKADMEARRGHLTVALLPARTDTQWFHDYCAGWHVNFLRSRLKFHLPDGKTGSAPFPSMIVYFGIPR